MRIAQALQAVADRQKRQDAALRRNEAIKAALEGGATFWDTALVYGVSLHYVDQVFKGK